MIIRIWREINEVCQAVKTDSDVDDNFYKPWSINWAFNRFIGNYTYEKNCNYQYYIISFTFVTYENRQPYNKVY